MRVLLLVLCVTSSASAQAIRFKGSGAATSNHSGFYDQSGNYRYDLGGAIEFEGEYANDLTVPLIHPNWSFDISTDGQSVTIHEMSVSYSGRVDINPLVWIDLDVRATITDTIVDINPSTTTVWTIQGHSFSNMTVSGVYHGIGLTREFSGTLPDVSNTEYEKGRLDFAAWPNQLQMKASTTNVTTPPPATEYREFRSASSNGWIGVEPFLHIREIRVWEPASVSLLPFVESADFDASGVVDGNDLLAWQRGVGIGTGHSQGDANMNGVVDAEDLSAWVAQCAAATAGAGSAVPEPTALALLLGLCFCLRPAASRLCARC